jgi:hypothetical protein
MVPLGEGEVDYLYMLNGQQQSNYAYYTMNSTDGTAVDVVGEGLEILVPIEITLFDGAIPAQPVPGQLIELLGYPNNNTGNAVIYGETGLDGVLIPDQPSPLLPLGWVDVDVGSPYNFHLWRRVPVEGQEFILDIGSSNECLVQGTVFDLFGVGVPNATYNYYSYQGIEIDNQFTTDANGEFSFFIYPGNVAINSFDFSNYRNLQINHCRENVPGVPRVIRLDISHFDSFFGES